MKASKFPVTYHGFEYRVSVELVIGDEDDLWVIKIYTQRTNWLRRLFPFKFVRRASKRVNFDDPDNMITAATAAVISHHGWVESEQVELNQWREIRDRFASWDGQIDTVHREEQ